MWMRNLILSAGVAAFAVLGCARDREMNATEHVVSSFEQREESLPMLGDLSAAPSPGLPSGWVETSAAYPTGWADAAERRCAEDLCAPTAIGGGPQSR